MIIFSINLTYGLEPQGPKFSRIQKQEIQLFKQKTTSDLNPNLNYIKITTNRDAPALVPMDKVLSIIPDLLGKDYKNLILLHRNLITPYYVIDDNEKIDPSDTLIFLGSRAIGDTTWFDHYSSEEPFFLTYDTNSNREELKLIIDDGNFSNNIPSIQINAHYEKDLVYSHGPDVYDSHTTDNEGWYWKELLPYKDQPNQNTFSLPLIIRPLPNTIVNLQLVFKSTTDTLFKGFGSNKYPEYKVAVFVNGDSLDAREFTRIYNDTFKLSINSNKLHSGLNIVQLKSYEVHPYRLGVLGVDYLKLFYLSQAYKYDFINNFELSTIQSKSNITIPNFSSDKVIAIDKHNKTIQFPKVFEDHSELFVLIDGQNKLFGAYLNDSSVVNNNIGIHLVKISENGSLIHEHHYYYDENAFKKLLNDATNEDIFIFAYNEVTRKIPQEFLKALRSFVDFTKIENLPLGNMALVIFQKNKLLFEDNISIPKYANSFKFEQIQAKRYAAKILVPPIVNGNFFIASSNEFAEVNLYNVKKPYLFNKNQNAKVVVIYHKQFEDFKNKYIELRKKTDPHLTFKDIDVEDIFNEFNYGKKSPYSIKNFLYYARNNWKDSLQALVLIGNASWDVSRRMSHSVSTDFVPSYGFPPADYWYALLDEDLSPDLNVGRISIHSVEDGENYLSKLIDYYAIPDQPWMKNFLFLSGGENDDERAKFAKIKSYFFDDFIKYGDFCGTSDSVAKYDKNIGGTAEASEIRNKINNGALWVNFLGHANQSIFDMDGWQVQKLNNYQKYSFFSTISCNTGAHADPGIIHSRNEEYVYFKNKGFIGSIGSSTYGWVDENRFIILRIVQNLSDKNSKIEYIGDLLNYGKNGLANEGAQLQTKFHNALIGDPLLKLRVSRNPNLYVFPQSISIVNSLGSPDVSVSDTIVTIYGEIYNNGLKLDDEITIRIYNIYNSKINSIDFNINSICFFEAFKVNFDISNQPGEHRLRIIIDPEEKFPFLKKENKIFEKSFYIYSPTLLPIDPQENWNVSAVKPVFRVINKLHNEKLKYYFRIENSSNFVYQATANEIKFEENYIEWQPKISLIEGYYRFVGYYLDEDSLKSNDLVINFFADPSFDPNFVKSNLVNTENFEKSEKYRVNFSRIDNTITIKDNPTRVRLVSVSGDWDRNIVEWGVMEVGNKVYLDARYYRGFNILVFPDSSSDVEPTYRRFDTWVDGDEWLGDSSSIRLNLFLRDSVPENSYVFIATSSRSFKIPVLNQMYRPESVGSMDTLRAILRNYGSKLIDSIQGEYSYPAVSWYGWKHSFVFVGKKGWKPGQAVEALRDDGDTAMIETTIDFISRSGSIKFSKVGPISKIKQIKVISNADIDSTSKYTIKFEIYENNSSNGKILSYKLNNKSEIFNLDTLRLTQQYFDLLFSIERSNINSLPLIDTIVIVYEPPAELAISKKETIIDNPVSTRDINNTLFFTVENISNRKSASNIDVTVINNQVQNLFTFSIDTLKPNQKSTYNFTLISDNLDDVNKLAINLNSNKQNPELYFFNNSHKLDYLLINDKSKPKIKVTFDDREVKDADFVSLKPLVKVELYDDFLMPYKGQSNIEIFVNGLFITPNNTEYYLYETNTNRDNLKATLYFIPSNLEYGNSKISPANYFKFIGKDLMGNSDTLIVRVNVQQNNSLSEVSVFPNPINDNKLSFKFKFLGRNIQEKILISIYNINGQLVNTFQEVAYIGNNEITIPLLDSFGSSIPAGVYFFRLEVLSQLWTEPANRIFIKVK